MAVRIMPQKRQNNLEAIPLYVVGLARLSSRGTVESIPDIIACYPCLCVCNVFDTLFRACSIGCAFSVAHRFAGLMILYPVDWAKPRLAIRLKPDLIYSSIFSTAIPQHLSIAGLTYRLS